MEDNMETSWRDICFCHPPLKMNYSGNMMFTTYNLDAICPHCKAPFRECKPELIISNLETEKKMIHESFNSQLEDLIEDMQNIKTKAFKESLLTVIFIIITIIIILIFA